MTQAQDTFFELGADIAAARYGLTRDDLLRKRASAKVMASAEAAPFHRELCKIAYSAFEADGEAGAPEAILFRNLAQADEWHTSYNRFTDSVVRALSKPDFQKEASALLPGIALAHDKVGGGIMKTLTAGGALGGAALGSIAFLLARNARQSSAENEQLLQKVKAYKQLKREIQEDMATENTMGEEKPEESYHV